MSPVPERLPQPSNRAASMQVVSSEEGDPKTIKRLYRQILCAELVSITDTKPREFGEVSLLGELPNDSFDQLFSRTH